MGFDYDLQLQGGCVITQSVETLGNLVGRCFSSGLFTDDVTKDTNKPRVEFGSQVQVRTPDNHLAFTFGGIRRVERDRGGESADKKARIIKFTTPLGQGGRGEIGDGQKVGFPLNQADFDTVKPGVRPVADHLRE